MTTFIIIAEVTKTKLLAKHGVTPREVEQCFENRAGRALSDTREEHQTNPPTYWFIAPTNNKRNLKDVYILLHGKVHIKTCYEPNDTEKFIYQKHGE